jgi:tRNA acetyltransferase TAN1
MKWEATQKISPSELVRRMLTNTRDTGEPVSRHTLRIVPVEKVSYAAVEDVVKAAKPLIDETFPADCEKGKEKTFAVVFNSRANSSLRRSELVPALAALVPEPHKVELGKPDIVVLVEAC